MKTQNDYNQAELQSATAARQLCRAHAHFYADRQDTDVATFAALHLALEDEAAQQGIKFRLVFGIEDQLTLETP